MGVDRPGAGTDKPAEAAEEPPPADHGPPPDRRGAEGAPSRADSRNGAAAANETSNQAAENQREDKPDTAQARPETAEREDDATVENEPEAPATSESNEGPSNDGGNGEQYDNNLRPEDTGGRPDTAQPSDELGDPKDTDQREQAPDGQMDRHPVTADYAERVMLGGRKVPIRRPRVRAADGSADVAVPAMRRSRPALSGFNSA